MAVTPTYPSGILPWVNRIDQQNTVYANDSNTLAADLIAVESTLGTNPQIELAPPVGSKVTYQNVSARIHDVQMGNQLPVVSLFNTQYVVKRANGNPIRVAYNKLLDDFGFHNGTDITVQASGWYIVTIEHVHEWSASGWFDLRFILNGSLKGKHRWNWDFPENNVRVPGFSPDPTPQTYTYQGPLNKGDRLSVQNVNNTGKSIITVSQAYLRLCFIRALPAGTAG